MKNTIITYFASMVIAGSAFAVDRLVPSQYSTIQAAIDAAVNGDVVQISPGSYEGPVDTRGKAITVRGIADAASVVVSGGASVVSCTSGETATTLVENLTISGGLGRIGAGMRIESASPVVRNCRIVGNSARIDSPDGEPVYGDAKGGGIYVRNGVPQFMNCLVAGNVAAFTGGGFSSGSAMGGAIYLESSDARFTNCNITGNLLQTATLSASGFGGAVCVWGVSRPTFQGCSFASNGINLAAPYPGQGGGCNGSGVVMYYQSSAQGVIDNCTFRQNVGAGCGLGQALVVMATTPGQIYVSNSTFCGNNVTSFSGTYIDLGNNRFPSTCPSCSGDLNGDNQVNGADLGLLLTNWGPCPN
jgi:hypothetical protein